MAKKKMKNGKKRNETETNKKTQHICWQFVTQCNANVVYKPVIPTGDVITSTSMIDDDADLARFKEQELTKLFVKTTSITDAKASRVLLIVNLQSATQSCRTCYSNSVTIASV